MTMWLSHKHENWHGIQLHSRKMF